MTMRWDRSFGGCIICIVGALLGPIGGNLQGLEAAIKSCWAVGWQPTGFGGYIIDMPGPLLGQQVGKCKNIYLDLSPSGCH